MTELLSHDPSWAFRRTQFSSQSKHVPSEVIHRKHVLLFITHQQYTASELLWSSRVYSWHHSLNRWPCMRWLSRKGGNECQLCRSIFVHIYVKQRQLCFFVVTCKLLKSCCSQRCHQLFKWLWKAGCRYCKTKHVNQTMLGKQKWCGAYCHLLTFNEWMNE